MYMPRYENYKFLYVVMRVRERLKISSVLFRICMTQIQATTTRNPTPRAVTPGQADFPYSSKEELPGRKTDEELRSLVAAKLKKMSQIDTTRVVINVVDQIVSITGSVQTYEQKRRLGEEIWKIEGVVRVLNELHITEPSTAGPARRD